MFGYYSEKELKGIGFASVGKNVMISRSTELVNIHNIYLGNNCRIDTFCIIAPSGDAVFRIGNFVHICAYTILNGLSEIILEDFSGISSHCTILSSEDDLKGNYLTNATVRKDFLGTISAPVIIRKHSTVGTGSTILPGVVIETGTVIGAHSLVKSSTIPFSIMAGTPAKIIGERSKKILEMEKIFLRTCNDNKKKVNSKQDL